MPAHKLVLDDVFEQPFKLLAVHSSIEEFKLAFLLNKHLNLRLARTRKDIDFQYDDFKVLFAHYVYEDQQNYCKYHLVSNISRGELITTTAVNSLFGDGEMSERKAYLLPDFKRVDYFLKIEDDLNEVSEKKLLAEIKEIPQISTAYSIESQELKFKENLIFD